MIQAGEIANGYRGIIPLKDSFFSSYKFLLLFLSPPKKKAVTLIRVLGKRRNIQFYKEFQVISFAEKVRIPNLARVKKNKNYIPG